MKRPRTWWQEEKFRESEKKLKETFLRSHRNGKEKLTITELTELSSLTRPTVMRHLQNLIEKGEVIRENKKYSWAQFAILDHIFKVVMQKKIFTVIDEGRSFLSPEDILEVYEEAKQHSFAVQRKQKIDLFGDWRKQQNRNHVGDSS